MKVAEIKKTIQIKDIQDFMLDLECDQEIDESFYNSFLFYKKTKRKRLINEPLPSLKKIQKKLLILAYEFVELRKQLTHRKSGLIIKSMKNGLIRGVTAYRPKFSVIRNAQFHKNQELIIKLDINDFFGSVNKKLISDFWRDLWSQQVQSKEQGENRFSAKEIHELTEKTVKLTMLNGSLPQGSPTSGYIANCVLDEFDKIILTYCTKRNLKYSRYSDDITISGDKRNSQAIAKIISFVSFQLKTFHFQLHKYKTRVLKKNNCQIVTGIVLNEKLSAPRKLKKQLRQHVYYLLKYSNSHISLHHSDEIKYLNRLIGRINWVLQIETKNQEFITYKSNLMNLKRQLSAEGNNLKELCEKLSMKSTKMLVE